MLANGARSSAAIAFALVALGLPIRSDADTSVMLRDTGVSFRSPRGSTTAAG